MWFLKAVGHGLLINFDFSLGLIVGSGVVYASATTWDRLSFIVWGILVLVWFAASKFVEWYFEVEGC